MSIMYEKYYKKETNDFHIEKYGVNGLIRHTTYADFSSFANALKNDLSGADLYDYDFNDVDLKKYKFQNAGISSSVLVKQNLYDGTFYKENILFDTNQLPLEEKNLDLSTPRPYIPPTPFSLYNNNQSNIYYISDIHLNHKLLKKFPKCATKDEVTKYISDLVKEMFRNVEPIDWGFNYLLVGGDISFNYEISEIFYKEIIKYIRPSNIFVVLGNHELWNSNFNDTEANTVESITKLYSDLFTDLGINLLNNDLICIKNHRIQKLNSAQIATMSKQELRTFCLNSTLTIFGGTGFSGYNKVFNADLGLYRSTIKNLKDDLFYTKKFEIFYKKLSTCLNDFNIICLTHMPKEDWTKEDYQKNWIYVNGHTHRNYYYISDTKTIYADNQIGYKNTHLMLKYFNLTREYDIFKEYKDGIYPVSVKDYLSFYLGLGLYNIQFNRKDGTIYMVKKDGFYCFFYKSTNGKTYLLNGGQVRLIRNQDLQYYYDKLSFYANALSKILTQYNDALKEISEQIKKIDGIGSIHGCIVDIDYWSHIYLNPLDGKITFYYAYDTTSRTVYPNLSSILIQKCPNLYSKIQNSKELDKKNSLIFTQNSEIPEKGKHDKSNIYGVSRIFKNLQYTTSYKIIRNWNESLLKTTEKEDKNILSNIMGLIEIK